MPRFPSLVRDLSSALTIAGLLLAFSSGASAQSAKDLYDQGMAALNAGRYADAAQALDASYRAQPTAIVLYNLGLAYKGMGHPDKAQEAFESYVKFADPKKEGKTINAVKAEIERMKNGYARFALKLTPANAQILIDGAPAAASNGELWVQTGPHKIAFKADGYEDYEQQLDVAPGRFDLEVNLRQAGPADQRAAALIEAGIALEAAANFTQARDKYVQAQSIYPTPRGAGLAGLVQEQTGDLPESEANIQQALGSPKDKWVRQNRPKLRKALKRVSKQLATLDVSGTPAGAAVTINNKPVGNLPLGTVRVIGGSLTVHAKKDGFSDYETVLDLPAGAKRAVRIDMDSAPPPVVAAPVVAPKPAPEAVPALAEPEPKPVEPVPVAQPEGKKPTQADMEAETEPQPYAEAPQNEDATGFEMALNFGYMPWIGGPKTEGNKGVLAPQIVLGARIIWPLSFGLQLNGGFDTSTPGTSFVVAANPGLYVRGHVQRYKHALGWDAWAGVGLQPVAMQVAVKKAKKIDETMVDQSAINDSTRADLARANAGVDTVRTVQSLNLPFELGGAFYITESFGIDLSLALTLWMPQQSCLHDGTDRLCVDSKLKNQTSLFFGGGIVLLP